MIQSISRLAALAVCGVAMTAAGPVAAAWPEKPVRMIVPFGTGGGTDIQARLLADNLRSQTGQNFVIENRSGAGGTIGAQIVVEQPGDGYTMLFTTATLAINTTLYSKRLKFNTRTDLVPSTMVSTAPNVLCVHPSVPARSVKELITLAKKNPGKLNNGVNTPGSTSHLAGELFAQLGDLKTVIIAYTGGGPAMAGLITGDVDFLFATGPVASRAMKTGRVHCLGVTTPERNKGLPELPPIKEVLPGMDIGNWYSMFFPKGTDPAIANKMSQLIKKALADKKIESFFEKEGIVSVASSPAELKQMFEADIKKYAALIKSRKIPLR